jgi:hypothetical protein
MDLDRTTSKIYRELAREIAQDGRHASTPGAVKHDHGKPRVGLMMRGFPRAMLAVAEVTTFGAEKYEPDGWQHVDGGIERYNDALDRHLLARHISRVDSESQLPHLAHAAWNALAVLELELRRLERNAGKA